MPLTLDAPATDFDDIDLLIEELQSFDSEQSPDNTIVACASYSGSCGVGNCTYSDCTLVGFTNPAVCSK